MTGAIPITLVPVANDMEILEKVRSWMLPIGLIAVSLIITGSLWAQTSQATSGGGVTSVGVIISVLLAILTLVLGFLANVMMKYLDATNQLRDKLSQEAQRVSAILADIDKRIDHHQIDVDRKIEGFKGEIVGFDGQGGVRARLSKIETFTVEVKEAVERAATLANKALYDSGNASIELGKQLDQIQQEESRSIRAFDSHIKRYHNEER